MRKNFIFQKRYLIFHRSHARRNFIFNEEILFSKSKQISIFTEVLSEELEELEHNRTGRKCNEKVYKIAKPIFEI